MPDLSSIKSQVMYLYKTNPEVHIDIINRRERKYLSNTPATITGVYSNVFTMKFREKDIENNHTLQYADILTHFIEIAELNQLNNEIKNDCL